jgi:hypothetical protein
MSENFVFSANMGDSASKLCGSVFYMLSFFSEDAWNFVFHLFPLVLRLCACFSVLSCLTRVVPCSGTEISIADQLKLGGTLFGQILLRRSLVLTFSSFLPAQIVEKHKASKDLEAYKETFALLADNSQVRVSLNFFLSLLLRVTVSDPMLFCFYCCVSSVVVAPALRLGRATNRCAAEERLLRWN